MALTNSMRAIEIEANALKLTERPIPTPEDHQVLIKTAAAGVNRPDIMQRKGLYPPPADASDIPGL
ncbi:MAG: NAD(P)H quinone oxidoreductase, partial [Methylococcaceae bacterium NSM2-1]